MPSPQKISSDDLIRSENGSYLFNNKSYSTASETLNAYIEKHTGYTINDASHYHYYLPSVLLASTPVRNKSMVEENKPNIHVYSRAAKDHDSINKFAINQTKLRSQQSPQSYPEKVFSANKAKKRLDYRQNSRPDTNRNGSSLRNNNHAERFHQSSKPTINQSQSDIKNRSSHKSKVKFEMPAHNNHFKDSTSNNWTDKDWIQHWSSQAQANLENRNQSIPTLSPLASSEIADVYDDGISNATSDVDVAQLIDMYRYSLRKHKLEHDENKRFVRQMKFRYGSPELRSRPPLHQTYNTNSYGMQSHPPQNQPLNDTMSKTASLFNRQDKTGPRLIDQYHNASRIHKAKEKAEILHDLESVKTEELLLFSPNGIPSEREKADRMAKYDYHHLYDKLEKLKKIADSKINDEIESTLTDHLVRKSPMPYIAVSPTASDFTAEDHTAILNHSTHHYRTHSSNTSPIRSPQSKINIDTKKHYSPKLKQTSPILNTGEKLNNIDRSSLSLQSPKQKQEQIVKARPIETLKQMIFNVQTAASESDDISDSHVGALTLNNDSIYTMQNNHAKAAIDDPLQRAIHHLARLKAFVRDES